MALVHKLLTAAGALTTSAVVTSQTRVDENAAFSVQWNNVGTFTVQYEAHMEGPDASSTGWFLVSAIGEGDTDANFMAVKTAKLYPKCRLRLSAVAGGAVVSAWLME